MPSRWRSLGGLRAAHAMVRRVVCGGVLASYLALLFGIPVPMPGSAALPKGDESFPCQSHACGCRTADDCRERCCCFSPAQRLAWANRQPTDAPLAAAEPKSCCTKREASARPSASDEDASPRVVFVFSAQRCQGTGSLWWMLDTKSVPPVLAAPAGEARVVGRVLATVVAYDSLTLSPPVPPPRTA